MAGYVLDASALLTTLLDEPGAAEIEGRLPQACISAVNLSEVVAKLTDHGTPPDVALDYLASIDLDVRPFEHAQAERAGTLRPATRHLGLSLGDRACLALAAELGWTAVTADRAWAGLQVDIAIEVIR